MISVKEEEFTSNIDLETIKRGIDLHVHFREPGLTQKETLRTGMIAAHLGGIGTVLEMPNTIPAVDRYDHYIVKDNLIKKEVSFFERLGIEFRLFQAAALTDYNCGNLEELQQLNSVAKILKVFMANSTGNLGIEEANLVRGLSFICDETTERPLLIFHAELPDLISKTESWIKHHLNRPKEAEIQAVKRVLDLQNEFDLPMHITHVSTFEAATLLSSQTKVTWDVLPKHLEFSFDDMKRFGNLGIMNPPLRPEQDRKKLYDLFMDEKIHTISSDHAPHTLDEKKAAISGAPGVQETMMFLIDKWLSEEISKKYVEQLSYRKPKELLEKVGLKPTEGELVISTELDTKVDKKWVKSKCGWSLWEGKTLKGRIMNSYPEELQTDHFE